MEKLGEKDIEGGFYSNDFANDNLESEFTHTVSLLMLYSAQTMDEPLAFHMSMEDYCYSLIHATHNAIVCGNRIQKLRVKLFEDGGDP